ncbi:ABC transporter G member 31 [Dionaea muscipula]
MKELIRLEKEKGIRPSPEIDAFMKASSVGGKKHSIWTDYVLKVLGLDLCSDTIIGDGMQRGVSGGQRKRVTTGEMIVGPRKTLFMDEISNGLDSSTTFQIVQCIRNFVHQMEGTVLMALLQPPPETFDLFDDLILLAEGHMVYHGPRGEVLEFFESLGFKLPPRKSIADFLQEVTSKKDQAQYWVDASKPYKFIPAAQIAEAFKHSRFGRRVEHTLTIPYDKTASHPDALSMAKFATSKWELFKTCLAREALLINRHRFLYIFRTCQVASVALVTSTAFIRTRIHPSNETYGDLYLCCLFFGLIHMLYNGYSELSLMIFRLPVFYKQRDNCLYPAWSWSFCSWLLRIPYSVLEAIVWSVVVYYIVGFAPAPGRFFGFIFVHFALHQLALGLFQVVGTFTRNIVVANSFSSAVLLTIICLSGFILPKDMFNSWLIWAYWVSPMSYALNAISVNEFTASRWMKTSSFGNTTVGYSVLHLHNMPTEGYWYWLGVGALLLYTLLFNSIAPLALTYLNPQKSVQVVIPLDTMEDNKILDVDQSSSCSAVKAKDGESHFEVSSSIKKEGMILPFKPLTMTFHNVNYFVDMPKAIKTTATSEKRLQLLSNVSGVFSPGILTALMGSSGAGKTTLMDVLAGRKTGGYIEGDIRISGHPKEQHTFARISGYVEQNDIHSPQVTVEESLWFSSHLRLSKEVTQGQKHEFLEEVMRLVELDNLRHALVGIPGTSGLSTEQRKRLTIAVELVANPSVIFMDEPTSGLDARAAAIVMRAVRNTVDTGRTVVCTIHQPSIDIFEAFDELLLVKRGGQVIYGGKLGVHSQIMIDYFQGIRGVSPIVPGYNPATWMLEMTSPAMEERIGVDFADIYKMSNQYREVDGLIGRLSIPPTGSEPLIFDSAFSQDILSQFWICFRKQNLVYWRSPQYNGVRIFLTMSIAIILGLVFWGLGSKRDSAMNLFAIFGALYSTCFFMGMANGNSVQPVVATERAVFYREKAAGMYSPLPFAAAQGLVEVPYIALQTLMFSFITYPMIDFEWTIRKCLLYFLFLFLTFTYFTFYGMMAVGVTPTQHIAAVTSTAFYSFWNLFTGFLITKQNIPGWWIWFYYISPVSWTLDGLFTSQLGDVETMIVTPGFSGSVKEYLKVQYGFDSKTLGVSVAVLVCFCVLFVGIFMASFRFLNFQRR